MGSEKAVWWVMIGVVGVEKLWLVERRRVVGVEKDGGG